MWCAKTDVLTISRHLHPHFPHFYVGSEIVNSRFQTAHFSASSSDSPVFQVDPDVNPPPLRCSFCSPLLHTNRLLLGLFPPSRVARIVTNIILTLSCPVLSSSFNPHVPYLFYTSLSNWFSVFVFFMALVHLTFVLARVFRPFS